MIGLFQELGPCRMNNDSMGTSLNPTAWNNNANVYVPRQSFFFPFPLAQFTIYSLFIDQPVGVGYSFGRTVVGTSQQAAQDVWKVKARF